MDESIIGKEKEIKREAAKIKKLYKDLPEERKKLAEKLIERAAFMAVSLAEMELKINTEGQVVKMPQGSYTIERAHPLLTAYNSMIKNYTAAIKQLDAILADSGSGAASKPGQQLLGWLGSGNGQNKN